METLGNKEMFFTSKDGKFYFGTAFEAQEFLLKSGIMLTPYDGEPDEMLVLNIGHELEELRR